MENTSDSFMPRPLLFCLKSGRSVCYSVPDNNPGVNESGQFKQRSNRASKNGSTRLRKTLFQVMSTYLQNKPVNEPIYQFLDRKRAEGKPYLVYMTAGANKFLRIYYGKVKECLRNLEQSQIEES